MDGVLVDVYVQLLGRRTPPNVCPLSLVESRDAGHREQLQYMHTRGTDGKVLKICLLIVGSLSDCSDGIVENWHTIVLHLLLIYITFINYNE